MVKGLRMYKCEDDANINGENGQSIIEGIGVLMNTNPWNSDDLETYQYYESIQERLSDKRKIRNDGNLDCNYKKNNTCSIL